MRLRFFVAFVLLLSLPIGMAAGPSRSPESKPEKLPLTTASAAAARYFEKAAENYENHRWNFALRDWNEAIKLDPSFAQAYVWICMTTADPAEEARDRAK